MRTELECSRRPSLRFSMTTTLCLPRSAGNPESGLRRCGCFAASCSDRRTRGARMGPVRPRLLVPALPRLVLAVVAGAVCGVAAAYAGAPDKGVLSGIAVSGTVFVVLGWWVLWPMDADTTHASV